jgi:hypothetical protein
MQFTGAPNPTSPDTSALAWVRAGTNEGLHSNADAPSSGLIIAHIRQSTAPRNHILFYASPSIQQSFPQSPDLPFLPALNPTV